MPYVRLVFRLHAVQRMFEREISEQSVRSVLSAGEAVEFYDSDQPFPSVLWLGWILERPIHVVAADNPVSRETIIITVYEPDADRWEDGFRRRRAR